MFCHVYLVFSVLLVMSRVYNRGRTTKGKIMRRTLSTLLFMLIISGLTVLPALAHDVENAPPASDLEWVLSGFGVLMISLALLTMLIRTVIDLRQNGEHKH